MSRPKKPTPVAVMQAPVVESKPGPQIAPPVVIGIEPVSLDIKNAAAFLNTSVRQIRTLIYSRELTPVMLGKKQVILVEDLRNLIQSKKRAA